MKQPTKEQYSSLSPVERFSYRCADYCNQRLKEPLIWWNRTFMFSLIWIGLSQRLFLHGLKNIESLNEQSRVVIAANHRTFFDFFVRKVKNLSFFLEKTGSMGNFSSHSMGNVKKSVFFWNFLALFRAKVKQKDQGQTAIYMKTYNVHMQ